MNKCKNIEQMNNLKKKFNAEGPSGIDEASKDWLNWCRLCAKPDEEKNIFMKCGNANAENNEVEILTAISSYFGVEVQQDELLPTRFCAGCLRLLAALLNFHKHVAKVQQMYAAFKNIKNNADPSAMRFEYGLLENERPHELMERSLMSIPHLCESKIKACNALKKTVKDNTAATLACNGNKIRTMKNLDDEYVEEIECKNPFTSVHDESNHSTQRFNDISRENNTKEACNTSHSKAKQIKRKSNLNSEELHSSMTTDSVHKYDCSKCSKSFLRIGSYRLHMNKKHGILCEATMFSCTKCLRSFKSRTLLKRHIKTHMPIAEKEVFPCPQCDRKFQTSYYVATHIKLKHEGARLFICEECGKALGTQLALNEHMLTHTDYAPFECEICKRLFKSQRRLKKHLDIHSTDNHTCSVCGLQLSSRITLNRHKLVHSDVMKHKCDYCGRAFKRDISLKDHLLLHSGLKPYSCEFCDRTFANSSNCRIHVKRMHPNEWITSGTIRRALNVPKLAVLKSVVQNAKNLVPVISKQSGNFTYSKKSKSKESIPAAV